MSLFHRGIHERYAAEMHHSALVQDVLADVVRAVLQVCGRAAVKLEVAVAVFLQGNERERGVVLLGMQDM